jgi:5-methylcytosine-specific restriction endonuclease McrA
MDYLERNTAKYVDSNQKEHKAKRAVMDLFMEVCSLAQIIEKDVRDDDSFKAVFEKTLAKTSGLKKSINRLHKTLSDTQKAITDFNADKKKKTTPVAGGGAPPVNTVVPTPAKRGRKPPANDGDPKPPRPQKETITKTTREYIWYKFIGNLAKAKCPICNKFEIEMTSFDAGHIVAEACGGPTNRDNLMPICHTCNSRMHTTNLYDYCRKNHHRDPVCPALGSGPDGKP